MKHYSILLLLTLYTCFIQSAAVLEQGEQGSTMLRGDKVPSITDEAKIAERVSRDQIPTPVQITPSVPPAQEIIEKSKEGEAPQQGIQKATTEPAQQQPVTAPISSAPTPIEPSVQPGQAESKPGEPVTVPVQTAQEQEQVQKPVKEAQQPVAAPIFSAPTPIEPHVQPEQAESKPGEPVTAPAQTTQEPVKEEQQPIMTPPVALEAIPELTEQEMEEEMLPDTQIANIDTTTLADPQGNWLFKRMWWERAQETYQKMKDLVDEIMDRRVDFFKQRSALDKDLFDTFYMELGMGFAEFSTIVQDLIDRLNQEQPEDEVISERRQSLLDSLRSEQTTIEQVKKNIDGLKQVDNAIEDSLGIVIETINAVRRYERDGWDYFKEIGNILNEKKARELFYRLDVAFQNVKQLSNYLNQAFASYFSELENRARSTVAELHAQLDMLKEKGIDLKSQVAALNQPEEITEPVQPVEEEEEEERVKKPTSWWRTIVDTVRSYF